MRDFRDAKVMARTLRTAMAARGVRLSQAEALELVARLLGERDWNTLAAAIDAAAKAETAPLAPKVEEPPPAPKPPERPPGTPIQRFTPALDRTLHRAVGLAHERAHEYVAIEHLLLALIDDPDALAVMQACAVDMQSLESQLSRFIADELTSLVREPVEDPKPTAGFHRVVQRAVIHVQSAGRPQVTGANLLVAIFSERESHACAFLTRVGLNRYDAVNFIAHGVRKDGKAA